jgi:RNA-directed DNA polymerase
VSRVAEAIVTEKTKIIDLDLRACFDNVQRYLVLAKVAKRVQDDAVMRLLKMILKATGKKGVPQGGVVTPLTQKVILTVWVVGSSVLGRTCRNRNAVTTSHRLSGRALVA